jgi:hypothetical protein
MSAEAFPHEDPADRLSWWARAMLASAVGFLFALFITIVLSLGLLFDFAPLKSLQRTGVDYGMRLFIAFAPVLDPRLNSKQPRSHAPSFVFFDVDEGACRAFRPANPELCRADKPVPPDLIVAFVRAARAVHPAVVVVDVAAPDDTGDREKLRAELAAPENPWIIAPVMTRPSEDKDELTIFGDPAKDITPTRAEGRLRLASDATSSDPEAGDGIVRRFAIASPLVDPGTASRWLPSVPYLAAMLSDPATSADADCAFYGQRCGAARHPAKFFSPAENDLRKKPPVNRIFFSLPSLVQRHDLQGPLQRRYKDIYVRHDASDYLTDKKPYERSGAGFTLNSSFAGKIIVLGSSLDAGQDIEPTPVGTLHGAEIIINSTRAFAEFAPLVETGPGDSFGARASQTFADFLIRADGVAHGALVLTIFWLAIFGVLHLTQGRDRALRLGANAAVAVLFLTGMFVAVLVEVQHAAEGLHDSLTVGRPVDVLTPLLGLGLEGYTEAASLVTGGLEYVLIGTVLATASGAVRFRSYLRSNFHRKARK